MSILLDALKKSEQQRQLGQTPTLDTAVAEQPTANATLNHWIPIALVVVSVSVMSWFGWQQLRYPESMMAPDAPSEPAMMAEKKVPPRADTGEPRTMTESYQASNSNPVAAEAPGKNASGDSDETRARLSRSVSEFTAENEPPEAAGQADDPAASERQQVAAAAPSTPEPVSPETPSSDPPATRHSAMKPHVSEPISYWELPQGVRDNLPEIRITVLVYASQSDDRFLLANGQRLFEKDELQSGLVLDEIRRDGAVFVYRKYRFLVKG